MKLISGERVKSIVHREQFNIFLIELNNLYSSNEILVP